MIGGPLPSFVCCGRRRHRRHHLYVNTVLIGLFGSHVLGEGGVGDGRGVAVELSRAVRLLTSRRRSHVVFMVACYFFSEHLLTFVGVFTTVIFLGLPSVTVTYTEANRVCFKRSSHRVPP